MLNKLGLLSDLAESIQRLDDSKNVLLRHAGDNEMLNAIQNHTQKYPVKIRRDISSEFLADFGIRNLLFEQNDGFTFPIRYSDWTDSDDRSQSRWHNIKGSLNMEELRTLFNTCKIISFSDWADMKCASDLWDGLRHDVIKPLGKKNCEFIFYLGNPAAKLVHEVDEILDIISDFSFNGKVTLTLNEREAVKLWLILKGQNDSHGSGGNDISSQDLHEIGGYIFHSMKIERLLIFSIGRTVMFSGDQQFELTGRASYYSNAPERVKENFNAGYLLGRLLQLEASHCSALGLTVSGAYLENGAMPDKEILLSYIKEWMRELSRIPLIA